MNLKNPKAFFDDVRGSLFEGSMTLGQVSGCERLIAACQSEKMTDVRQVAYVLATSYHETTTLVLGRWRRTMQPVEEIGRGADKPYGKPAGPYGHIYYGRGDCELTWLTNYQKVGLYLGIDLVRYPNQALYPAISAKILVVGMTLGWYTGRKLSDYINETKCDYLNARRVVNSLDCASMIAEYAKWFEHALVVGGYVVR